MQTRRALAALVWTVLAVGAGCGGDASGGPFASRSAEGSVAFALDFARIKAAGAVTITSATAKLTRSGHADVDPTLAVSNGVATGRVDGLAPGYWHVAVEAFDGATSIYKGSADVNVVAGVTVECRLLFDPVITPPTTGAVVITVGLNPMPGYKVLDQAVTQLLFHRASATFYVVDGTSSVIGVYDADTLVRKKDLAAPAAPAYAALSRDGAGIFLGYSTGRLHRLDVATGTVALVADALMDIVGIVPLEGDLVMVSGPGSYSHSTLKVIDVRTGQIVSTRSPWYSLTELLYNPVAKTVYSHHQGVIPTDIHYVKLDPATGAMQSDGDSVYHGDYSFGRPLRAINDGTRLATSSGGMFTSAELVTSDLRYSGNLGHAYVDLAADDAKGKLYLLSSGALPKLVVIDDGTYFVERTVDLAGTPANVLETATSIVVFATKDARTYARAFAKADLGL